MKTKEVLAIGIVAILVLGIGLVIAQEQKSPAQSKASLNPEDYNRIVNDLLTGKIDRPPGVKDYEPPANDELLPRPAPPIEQDRLIIDQDENLILPMSSGIAAGYQCFGGGWFKPVCGRVAATTSTVTKLKPEEKEWQVLHQWPASGENAIVITYYPSQPSNRTGIFGIYIGALGGYTGDYVRRPASNSFSTGIRPEHQTGSKGYTKIFFWIYDFTDGVYWSKTYTLPATQYIKAVDAALEHNDTVTPNSLWKNFIDFNALDQNKNNVNLKANFKWKEWPSTNMNNEHTERYYGTNYIYGDLSQRKTPK